MSTARHILSLLKSHIDGDDTRFMSTAMQIAAHEARQGHGKLAEEVKALVDAAKMRDKHVTMTRHPVPMAQPKGELANILTARYPVERFLDMILPDNLEARLSRVLAEQTHQQVLRSHGLTPRRKLLLVGPPGAGKTLTASALAGELHLPLFTVVLDGLITKFMGETAGKLRLVFDAMRSTRGVYFFDEFDAIGARRTERQDVGEIRRVLNSFLQFLEQDESQSVVVAATNHPELLDPALFRRFDDVIEYQLPHLAQIDRLMRTRLSVFDTQGVDWEEVGKVANGLSQAEIVRASEDAAKTAILGGAPAVSTGILRAALIERKNASARPA